jgi:hypothetical protein
MKPTRVLSAVWLIALPLWAQPSALRGRVTDASGALVPGAAVTIAGAAGFTRTTVAGGDGGYAFAGLPAGAYTVQASAPQLAMPAVKVSLKGGGTQQLDLQLKVAASKQELTIQENGGPGVGTEAAGNASALVLTGSDLDALSDNADDLAADLQALAGPSAGPNGGSIFIDGFSGGQLPPKDAIREIRINQNPFSAEYDKLGFGRIEIFTKPGSDKFRGLFQYNYANAFWNTRNPYAAEKAPFQLDELEGNISGPLARRASFYFSWQKEWVDNGAILNGVSLDPQTLAASPFNGFFVNPQRRTVLSPRADFQLSTNHTLTVRYSFNRDEIKGAGIGGFNLTSRGYHSVNQSQTVQLTETAVLGASAVNESRFQYFRPDTEATPDTTGTAIQVLGSFSGGASPAGRSSDLQNTYELQNNTSIARGLHAWRFGVRLRGARENSESPQNFAGTFTFGGGPGPQLDAGNRPVLDAAGEPVVVNLSSIEQYRRTRLFQQQGLTPSEIRALGGGASQFTIHAGNPAISARQLDAAIFAGDDWKVRPNVTLSLGLRWEAQTNIHDRRDIAPRIGVAWAPGAGKGKSRPKSVIRAGMGIFYDRFALTNTLTALRFNGVVQQQYSVANPDFFPQAPAPADLAAFRATSTTQEISAALRAPYIVQSAVAFERQLPYNTTAAVTYANSHGLHLLRSEDLNAPLPGTFAPQTAGSGVFPLGHAGPLFLMESSGLYNQNQLIVTLNTKVNQSVSLNGSYVYNRAMSNTDGVGTFAANPYSMAGEYGPAATDIRHRVSLSGTVTTKWGIRLNPLLTANTGPPFDITAGQDLYGDTLFNARPGIVLDAGKPGVIATRYGLLDPNPAAGEKLLGRNYGRGPGQVNLNLRVGRIFGFGPPREGTVATSNGPGGGRNAPGSPFAVAGGAAAGGPVAAVNRRYNVSVSMSIRNLLNHNNPGPIIGNVTSPLFGLANQPAGSGGNGFSEAANNRRLELQTRFTF